MSISDFKVLVANASHISYAQEICDEIQRSAKVRGTGIAKRTPEYVAAKLSSGKAIIALTVDGKWAGFAYIESWENKRYIANSGLIVNPKYRNLGLAKVIKRKVFALSVVKYQGAKLFGLTTGLAVMNINNSLGYHPVPFSEITTDDKFWQGCESCINYPILQMKERKNCLCTAMIFDPSKDKLKFDVNKVLEKESFFESEL